MDEHIKVKGPVLSRLRVAGIVLAGGQSSRMGLDKATLPFGPERMLERVVRLLAAVVQPIVVVAAPRQQLPALAADVLIARDEREARGPLEGLLAGLSAIAPHAEAAYATSCDVPLLAAEFVRAMIERLENFEIAVPVEDDFAHPLAAVYRTTVLPHIRELLAADRLRPTFLFERVKTRRVPAAELRAADPELKTLRNLNQPADYLAALREAGFQPPAEILAALGGPRT
jgi:molybdopterin-guanine dinucleotide biosynthesis protein A